MLTILGAECAVPAPRLVLGYVKHISDDRKRTRSRRQRKSSRAGSPEQDRPHIEHNENHKCKSKRNEPGRRYVRKFEHVGRGLQDPGAWTTLSQ